MTENLPAQSLPRPEGNIPALRIGEFVLSRLPGGVLWLSRPDGEGMQIDEQRLTRILRLYYRLFF